jgi:hypothetical protein
LSLVFDILRFEVKKVKKLYLLELIGEGLVRRRWKITWKLMRNLIGETSEILDGT